MQVYAKAWESGNAITQDYAYSGLSLQVALVLLRPERCLRVSDSIMISWLSMIEEVIME